MTRKWNILVGRKQHIVAEFIVPVYKLDGNHLKQFLRALVIRCKTNQLEDMLDYYVNDRRGRPSRIRGAEVKWYFSLEERLNGFYCGDFDFYARATYPVSKEEAEAIYNILQQNKRAL